MNEQTYTWQDALERVKHLRTGNQSERADHRGLTIILTKALEWGLDPIYAKHACLAPVSNLRSAVSELRRAVRWDDPQTLAHILELCATMSNTNLRLTLHTVLLEDVSAVQQGDRVLVELKPEQFREVQSTMRMRHRYTVRQAAPVEPVSVYDLYQ